MYVEGAFLEYKCIGLEIMTLLWYVKVLLLEIILENHCYQDPRLVGITSILVCTLSRDMAVCICNIYLLKCEYLNCCSYKHDNFM